MKTSSDRASDATFLERVNRHTFEPFLIEHLIDPHGRYQLDLDRQFPLAIKLYSFTPIRDRYPLNWHERLEIFVPVAGSGRFRMGDEVVPFAPGDLLVVDNMKFHGLVDFEGAERRAIVVTFAAQLVYTLGSPLCDFAYLIPFHCRSETLAPVLPADHPLAWRAHSAIERLMQCYFDSTPGHIAQAGCKAHLLELLYYVSKHFQGAEVARSEYVRQQERAQKLQKLFEYLKNNYPRRISVREAADMVSMSESRFMKFFKKATGATFVSYLSHLRLTNACRLLRETDQPIAEIAAVVGFDDTAYFDRRFKQQFRRSPSQMRAGRLGA